MTQDFRAREYLKVADPETYGKHLDFFFGEVVTWATEKWGLSSKLEDRAVQGVSNGGAFAATSVADKPGVFGSCMAFSIAAYNRSHYQEAVKGKSLPKFYLAAGTLEVFIRGTNDARNILSDTKANLTYQTYTSGHDMEMWKLAFCTYIQQIFPPIQHNS